MVLDAASDLADFIKPPQRDDDLAIMRLCRRPAVCACGTSAILCAVASLQISETSAVDPGRNTSGDLP